LKNSGKPRRLAFPVHDRIHLCEQRRDTAKAGQAYRTFLVKFPNDELRPSVEWELKYLGKDIDDIPELTTLGEAGTTEGKK